MDDKNNFSLQQEIKKRKSQELLRAVEERKRGTSPLAKVPVAPTGPTIPRTPPVTENKGTSQVTPVTQVARPPADPRRMTQTLPAAKRASQTLTIEVPRKPISSARKRALIAILASITVGLVCVGTLAISASTSTTAVAQALPTASTDDVLTYLKKVNVGITNIQAVSSVSNPWHATQAIQFTARLGDQSGAFILLSYKSLEQKIPDMFRVSTDRKFKTWQLLTVSNIILLAPPEINSDLELALKSHLTTYLVSPYRNFLPTATPELTARSEANAAS